MSRTKGTGEQQLFIHSLQYSSDSVKRSSRRQRPPALDIDRRRAAEGTFPSASPKILLLARLKEAFVISNMLSCSPHGQAV